MLAPSYTKQYQKDLALALKRGKDAAKLKKVMAQIIDEQPLPAYQRDHVLVGRFAGRRECHIEPDWLLIYKVESGAVIFERTGTHADLFR